MFCKRFSQSKVSFLRLHKTFCLCFRDDFNLNFVTFSFAPNVLPFLGLGKLQEKFLRRAKTRALNGNSATAVRLPTENSAVFVLMGLLRSATVAHAVPVFNGVVFSQERLAGNVF